MIETIIYEYLTSVTDAPVCFEILDENEKFILIEKTGSSRENQLDSATLAIQSYAPTLYEAAELNEQVKELMLGAIALPEISSVSLNSDYNFTDTTTKRYRYQAAFEVYYYRR